jgi:hypothetical protein
MGAAIIPAMIPNIIPHGPIGPIGPVIIPVPINTVNMEGIMKESEEKLKGWFNAITKDNDGKSPINY